MLARLKLVDTVCQTAYPLVQIVELVAQGLDNAEIAASLYMGEGTVRNHISAILQKLQLRNRTQIAVMYYQG